MRLQLTSPDLASDLVGAAVLTAIFLGLLATAELWRRFGDPPAEWTRKLVHVGGGLACLLFPFLVDSLLVILALALGLTALFAGAGRLGFLKSLHGVERRSLGAEYYPLAVFFLLAFTGDRVWLYLAAIQVLAVGDAFAALIGSRYGRLRYEVEDSHKTLEGSLVFFVIAFLAIHLPTLLLTDLPRGVCVLAAVLVALLVTFFEAISLDGADNLFVPLAVAVILDKITRQPLEEVVYQNLSLLGLCLVIALLVWRMPYFNTGGALGLILAAYGAWSLTAWPWALPALGGLAVYLLVWSRASHHGEAPLIRVATTARALLGPFVLVALASGTQRFDLFFGPYLGASATVLALALGEPLFHLPAFRNRPGRAMVTLALVATAAGALPAWFFELRAEAWVLLAVVLLVGLAVAAVLGSEIRRHGSPVTGWTAARFLAAWAVAAAVAAIDGGVGAWIGAWIGA